MEKISESNTKAYRLAAQLSEDIERGKFASGVLLPPDGELATNYDVSRITMRKSLAILAKKRDMRRLPNGGVLATVASNASSEYVADASAEMERSTGQRTSESSARKATKKLTFAALFACGPNHIVSERFRGAQRYADEHDLRFVHFLASSVDEVVDILTRVEQHELDGVILNPFREEKYLAALRTLSDRSFPVVLHNRLEELPKVSSVMSNDGLGAYQAVHYLIEKYHRPVYYICAKADVDITPERYEGYASAMRDVAFDDMIDDHIVHMGITYVNPAYWGSEKCWMPGFYAADELFSKVKCPVSIFCQNDFDARGVYEAAKKHGLTVGEDVCVIGFGGFPLAREVRPSLSTCSANPAELGYEEARLLHRLMKGDVQSPVHVRLPMELTIRDSA